jgi:hypothetical protein
VSLREALIVLLVLAPILIATVFLPRYFRRNRDKSNR